MNKLPAVATLVALIACAGLGFCVVELKKMSGSLQTLEDKLAKLENGAPAGGGASGGSPTSGGSQSVADVASELKKLKAEVAAVKTEQADLAVAVKTGTAPKNPDGGTATPVNGDLKTAVEAVLAEREAAKEKERKEQEAKRAAEWQARMQQGVVDVLTRELGLTEQQKSQINDIVAAQMTTFREAMSNRKEGENPMEKMQALRTDTDTKIKAVLTPEQGTKYDELAKNPMALWGGAMGGFGGGGRRNGRSGPEGN